MLVKLLLLSLYLLFVSFVCIDSDHEPAIDLESGVVGLPIFRVGKAEQDVFIEWDSVICFVTRIQVTLTLEDYSVCISVE